MCRWVSAFRGTPCFCGEGDDGQGPVGVLGSSAEDSLHCRLDAGAFVMCGVLLLSSGTMLVGFLAEPLGPGFIRCPRDPGSVKVRSAEVEAGLFAPSTCR